MAKRFRVSLTFIENLLKRYRTDGTVEPLAHGGGQVAKLSPEQQAVLVALIEENNDAIKARVMRPTGATCWSTDQSSYVCVACALRVGTIGPKAQTYQEKKTLRATEQQFSLWKFSWCWVGSLALSPQA